MGCFPCRSSVVVTVALAGTLLLGAPAGSSPARARTLDSIQRLGSGTGLRWPAAVRTTSDGSLVFVLNETEGPRGTGFTNALASFRAQGDGAPELADLLHANTGRLLDVQEGVSIAVSPDDRHLYLGAMQRDPGSSSLIPDVPVIAVLAIRPDGGLDFRSLVDLDAVGELEASGQRPSMLLPSPDGRRLYVVATDDSSLRPTLIDVFERDPGSGRLRLLQELSALDELGLEHNSEVTGLAIAPDGEHLYLKALPFDFGKLADFVLTLDLAPDTGRITDSRRLPAQSVTPELRSIRRLFVSDDTTRVFASMAPEEVPGGGLRNRLLVFERDFPSGDLLAPRVLLAPEQNPDPDRFPRIPRVTAVSPDSLHAYQCVGGETLQVYRIDVVFETLEPVQTLELPPTVGSAPRCDHPRFAPDGRRLFLGDAVPYQGVGYQGGGSLTRLRRDPASGRVTVAGVAADGGADRLATVAVAPDGAQVYAIREDGDVSTFRRDADRSGRIAPLPDGTISLDVDADPSEVTAVLAPDGRHLYVGLPDEVVTLDRNRASGALRLLRRTPMAGTTLILSEDGRFAYAKSSASAITAYRRDVGSGALSPVQTLALPASGDTSPGGLTLGPGGETLYVASSDGSSTGRIETLGRNPASGRLEIAGEVRIPGGRLSESLVLGKLAVAPDGRHLYVVTVHDPDIVPFPTLHRLLRSPDDGSLRSDPLGNDSFDFEAFTFGLAPNGRTVYALIPDRYQGYDAIRPYLRAPDTGRLDRFRRPELQLGTFTGMALSPDGANLYAVGKGGIWVYANRWFESPEIPGFRFQVSIDPGTGRPLRGERVDRCVADTACAQGAVPGRTEALFRIVGPKPNGRLWPTLVKFSTSAIDVEIDQLATGEIRSYHLSSATAGSEELPGLFDREGFAPTPGADGIRWTEPAAARGREAEEAPPPPETGEVFTSDAFPEFHFQTRLTTNRGDDLPVRREPECFEETLCLSGAVPGRSELFLRIVGPKPNGRLWPTLVRTTTSNVEVWIEQVSTGQVRYYRLEGATPGSTDLSGLFDREGFLP